MLFVKCVILEVGWNYVGILVCIVKVVEWLLVVLKIGNEMIKEIIGMFYCDLNV